MRNRVAFSFSADAGRLVENVVHNQLRRCFEEVYFGTEGGETDFIVKEGVTVTRRIQVWYEDAPQAEIPARELAAFSELLDDKAECLLLTNDLEKEMEIGGTQVNCIPVVKFLLLGDCS
jgi:predicted AAA+ superfamily ATPase